MITLYISLREEKQKSQTNRSLKVSISVIWNSYWDLIYDQALFNNSIALNLLYILTLSDIDRDWILSSSEIRDQLYELQVKGNKKEVSDESARTIVCLCAVQSKPIYFDFILVFLLFSIYKLPESCHRTDASSFRMPPLIILAPIHSRTF